MPFLGPWLLMGALGTAGASVPIVLHFFFRSRYRTVPWAAMEFLLTSIEQTSRRLKFQELLLLILRCAVMLLVALALARPALSALSLLGGGGRDAVDAVFVIDNSFSMAGREGVKTRFELAKAAALNALDQLPPHSAVQIVTCGTAVSEPQLRDPGNLDQARKVIEDLELTDQATDLAPGLAYAVKTLKAAPAANRELYLFTDCQKQGFERNANEIDGLLADAKLIATIFVVRCGGSPLANVAIADIVPQKDIPRPGQRVGFAVVVRNTGASTLRQLRVSLAVDGDGQSAESQTVAELGPSQSFVVPLTARFEKPGLHVLTAFTGGDDLPNDNFLDRVIDVREELRVLVVDGNPNQRDPQRSSSFHFVGALAPTADAVLKVEVTTPRLAGGELLKDKALCVLCNVAMAPGEGVGDEVPTTEFVDALADFVRKGGSLLIYAGDRVRPEEYNAVLGARGLLPRPLDLVRRFKGDEIVVIDRKSVGAPSFQHLSEDRFYEHFDKWPILKTIQFVDGGGSDAAQVLLRYSNGLAAIVTGKVGLGGVMMVGTSADPGFKAKSLEPTWNYLFFFQQGYLPLVQAEVNYLLAGQSQSFNSVVGQTPRWVPSSQQAERNFVLIEPGAQSSALQLVPEGRHVPLGPAKKEDGQSVVVASGLTRAGVYYLTTRENDPGDRTPFAVAPDLRESSDLETLSDEEIDRQLGFAPQHFNAVEGQEVVFAAARTNREWTVWALVLALTVAASESALAWYCGRAWYFFSPKD